MNAYLGDISTTLRDFAEIEPEPRRSVHLSPPPPPPSNVLVFRTDLLRIQHDERGYNGHIGLYSGKPI